MDLQGTIQMTAAFSNAVLVAIMPYVSDFAAKLKLDLPLPLTTNQVQAFGPSNTDIGGTVVLTNGAAFRFVNGRIETYENPAGRRWDTRQEATTIDKLRLNPDQAVEAARTKIKALGYNLETLYADLQPKVKAPGKAYGKQYANYNIYWDKPNFQNRESVRARINGETGELEYLFLIGAPPLPPPPLPLKPIIKPSLLQRRDLDESEKHRLFEKLAPEMDSFAQKLGLPISCPIGSSQLKEIVAYQFKEIKSERLPETTIAVFTLTNGYAFKSDNGKAISGFFTPDVFFGHHHVRVQEMMGKWKLSKSQAIKLARDTARKLGDQDAISTRGRPDVRQPFLNGPAIIPRYSIDWFGETAGKESYVTIEVDAEHGRVTGLNFMSRKLGVSDFAGLPPPRKQP